MTTEPAIIDLGELPRGEPGEAEPEVAWPVRERFRRWRNRRGWRSAGTATATILLLLSTVAAATTPPEPLLRHQLTIPYLSDATVDQQHLYTVEARTAGAGSTLVAYRLDDGAVAWEAPLPSGAESNWVHMSDDVLLAESYSPQSPSTTTVFDPDTGEVRWSHDGWALGALEGLVLLGRWNPEPTDEEEITAVDLATGSVVWRLALVAQNYVFDQTRLVALEPGGNLSSYDLTTGEVLATVRTDSRENASLQIAGSLVRVLQLGRSALSLTAYDVDGLTLQWSLDLGAIPDGGTDPDYHFGSWPVPCGPLVCLLHEGAVPQALDPETGVVVWSASWLPRPGPDSWFDLHEPEGGLLAGHLTLSVGSAEGRPRGWLVDGRTGEPVLDLQRWRLAYSSGVPPLGSAEAMLTWHDDEATWFGRLRPDLSAVDLLGVIAHPPAQSCTLHLPQVLCWTYRGESEERGVDVWLTRW